MTRKPAKSLKWKSDLVLFFFLKDHPECFLGNELQEDMSGREPVGTVFVMAQIREDGGLDWGKDQGAGRSGQFWMRSEYKVQRTW